MLEKFDCYRLIDTKNNKVYQATKCRRLSSPDDEKESVPSSWYWRLDVRSGKSFFLLTNREFHSLSDIRDYLVIHQGVSELMEHSVF